MRVQISRKFILGFIIVIASILSIDALIPLLGVPPEWRQLVSYACGIAIGLLLGWSFSRAFTGNIRLLSEGAGRISRGDLSRNIRLQQSLMPDETEDLARSFNLVVDSLRQLVGDIRAGSVKVSRSAQALSSTAEEMSASSQEVARAIEQVSQGAEIQAEMVDRSNRGTRELATSVDLVAAAANKLAISADETATAARQGGGEAEKALTGMKQVLATIEQNSRQYVAFGEQVQQIGTIVDVITNIAQQTNLLALNATIEAARAGEYGRGFAVVAEEVRKLADSTGESAAEITRLIDQIREQNQKVQTATNDGIRSLDAGRQAIDTTGAAFRQIIATAVSTQEKAGSIAELSLKQSEQSDEVVTAIEEIAKITADNASATEEVSAATEEQSAAMEEMAHAAQDLSDLAAQLLEGVSSFQLGMGKDEV